MPDPKPYGVKPGRAYRAGQTVAALLVLAAAIIVAGAVLAFIVNDEGGNLVAWLGLPDLGLQQAVALLVALRLAHAVATLPAGRD